MADIGGVLGGDDHVHDAGGLAVHILHGDLGLGVGAQPFGLFACLANAGQLTTETVGVHDRRGHQLRRLIAGITKHDTLVAGALLGGLFALGLLGVHTLRDVGTLGGEVVVDEDFVGVENVVVIHIADAAHSLADDLADVDDLINGLGGAEFFVLELGDGDLTADDDDVALHKGLAGHAAPRIHGEACVEDGVGDGVGDFVGVAFTDGLGGEDVGAGHGWIL